MSDCVLDASAMVLALSGKTDAASALRARLVGVRRHTPHVIDAEVGNVLRRHEREARLSADEALLALRAAPVLVDHRYPHGGPLGGLAWTWRHNLNFYDGLSVALAVLLDLPLITGDVRLSRAPDLSCTVELVRQRGRRLAHRDVHATSCRPTHLRPAHSPATAWSHRRPAVVYVEVDGPRAYLVRAPELGKSTHRLAERLVESSMHLDTGPHGYGRPACPPGTIAPCPA